MSVKEYSLKLTKLSKYASYLVSNPRDEMNRFVTGVFDDLVEEPCATMLLTTWTFLVCWYILKKLRRVGLRGRIIRPRGKGPIMDVILRVGWKSKISQCLRRDSLTKFLLNFLRLVIIGCLTLILKEEKEVDHHVRKLLVPNVARSMGVNV